MVVLMDSSISRWNADGTGDANVNSREGTILNRKSDSATGNVQSAHLLKLRGISDDEQSENALLRSRIDEQSQLIMILKRRADEAVESAKLLQKQNSVLEASHQLQSEDLQVHVRRCNMLEARFNDLASNHQQMIEFKDEYKKRNAELQAENDQLRSENSQLFSTAIQERDSKIVLLEKSNEDKMEQITVLIGQCRKSEELLYQLTEEHELELNQIKTTLTDTEKSLADAEAQLHRIKSNMVEINKNMDLQLQKLTTDNAELLELSISRGRLVQEKQAENSRLQKKVDSIEKEMKNLQAKHVRDAAEVSINAEVQRLKRCMAESCAAYESVTREYEAFKKYSQSLLQQEKEINERLRHFVT